MGNHNDLPLNLTQRRQLLLRQTASSSNDPEMSEVLKTLRILSSASSYRRQQQIQQQLSTNQSQIPNHGHQCQNCGGFRVTQQQHFGCRNREAILKDLMKLEKTLEEKGEKLPDWVQEYKNGDSIKAAKLLHVDYTKQMKAYTSSNSTETLNKTRNLNVNINSNNKRPVKVEVVEATSTDNVQPTSTTASQSQTIIPHKKRRLDHTNESSD